MINRLPQLAIAVDVGVSIVDNWRSDESVPIRHYVADMAADIVVSGGIYLFSEFVSLGAGAGFAAIGTRVGGPKVGAAAGAVGNVAGGIGGGILGYYLVDHLKYDVLGEQTAREYVKEQHRYIADSIQEAVADIWRQLYNEFERRLPSPLKSR
jgi:Na+/glutamate symporter